jgi:hypothetical protein
MKLPSCDEMERTKTNKMVTVGRKECWSGVRERKKARITIP